MAANHAIADPQHPNSPEMPVNATLPIDEALGSDASEPFRRSASDPGRPVREFEAICAKHNLPCGAPKDLAPFSRALIDNKLLAMNFWSVVARLSDGRHGAALSQEQILAAIVQAVTGQSKDQIGPAQQEQVAQLARMLAGEDVATSHPPFAPAPPEPPAIEVQQPPSILEKSFSNNIRHSGVTQLDLTAAEPATHTAPEAAPAPRSGSRSRLVLMPDLSHPQAEAELPLAHRSAPLHTGPDPNEDEPRISIPLSAYTETEGRRGALGRAGAVLLTLVLLCGAALFLSRGVAAWREPGNTVQQAFSSFLQSSAATYVRVRDAIHGSSGAAHEAVTPEPAPSVAPDTEGAPVASAETAPAIASGTHAIAGTTPSSPAPPRTTVPSRARAEDATNDYDPARDAALLQIAGSEMRSHLFVSRFPIVPDTANANAVSGVVTLHAVITSRGTVEHAYATSGPPELRQPAIDAVSGWRYRPYMLNGQPIDVSTTIRVDFSGND